MIAFWTRSDGGRGFSFDLLDRLPGLVGRDTQDVFVRERLPLHWHALSFRGPGTTRGPSGTGSAPRSRAAPTRWRGWPGGPRDPRRSHTPRGAAWPGATRFS